MVPEGGRGLSPAELEAFWLCRFVCLYPVYINSKKTLAEGRRIPTEKVSSPS